MVKKAEKEATAEPLPEEKTTAERWADKEKYMAEFKELTSQLQIVDAEWSKRVSLESEREMLMLALAERKGIIAYLNSKGA